MREVMNLEAGRPETEVSAKAKRRRYAAEYKRRILREAGACRESGALGALLRREGLYSSHLNTWRAQADDKNACTEDLCDCTLESCDPETAISHVPVAEGTACPDADKCNGEESCDAYGACQPGAPVLVDDQNPCTIDACDPPTGKLSHAPAAKGSPHRL